MSPINLAIAGEESIRGRATGIFDKFAEAPSSIPDFFDKLDEAFHDVTSGAAITSVLEGVIGDLKDSLAVERLFNLSDYNIGSYISDYANQLYGQYYTQKWYIYHYNGSGGGSSANGDGTFTVTEQQPESEQPADGGLLLFW